MVRENALMENESQVIVASLCCKGYAGYLVVDCSLNLSSWRVRNNTDHNVSYVKIICVGQLQSV